MRRPRRWSAWPGATPGCCGWTWRRCFRRGTRRKSSWRRTFRRSRTTRRKPEEEDEEEHDEEEPLTPLNDPALGAIDPDDDTLFLRLQSSYAGAVTRLDAGMGRLLERLVALNPDDDVLIVCTADYGLALGEHGVVGPTPPAAHEETVHLPLILRLPGADEAGRRVAALTQAVDLAPTLADVFEAELPSAHGRTLLPLVYGEARKKSALTSVPGVQSGWARAEWSLRTHRMGFSAACATPDRMAAASGCTSSPTTAGKSTTCCNITASWRRVWSRTLRGFLEAANRPGAAGPPPLPESERAGAEASSPA